MINVPLAAEGIFSLGPLIVTNTLVNAFIALVIFFVVGLATRFGVKEIPGRFQTFLEMILEFLLKFFDQVTGDREKSKRFLPIAGTLFFFILISNWMGLLPGTGSIGVWHVVHGERELVPLLRPANSDLNLTLAMALVSVIGAHLVGIITLGMWRHTNKFIQIGNVLKALISLKPINILTALVEFVVGIIEIFSEFAKIASLSLRLFGNIFAGEVLMVVISSLVAFLVPLPFMAIELIVGIVQATVFATLTLVYLTMMTMPPHGEHAEAQH
ncbi:ATP synthase F0 subunit A [Candidatus Uhrbacteria bacterium]|nr:ATP synthase F0 subunit A [Candidatus Uhrbacteria bacterium]